MNLKTTIALLLAVSLPSCTDQDKENESSETQKAEGLEQIVLTEKPADAVLISALRTTAKPGDKVAFSGAVLGAMDVFMDNRAVMTMGDPTKITACNLIPDDHCETPWDVCCDDPDVIKASILTVQVVDAEGRPVKEGLKGLAGISELSQLVVTGEVAENSNAENMVINATGIFVEGEGLKAKPAEADSDAEAAEKEKV